MGGGAWTGEQGVQGVQGRALLGGRKGRRVDEACWGSGMAGGAAAAPPLQPAASHLPLPPLHPLTTSHASLAAAAPSRNSKQSAATALCRAGSSPLRAQLASADAHAGAARSTDVTCPAPAAPAQTLKPPV